MTVREDPGSATPAGIASKGCRKKTPTFGARIDEEPQDFGERYSEGRQGDTLFFMRLPFAELAIQWCDLTGADAWIWAPLDSACPGNWVEAFSA